MASARVIFKPVPAEAQKKSALGWYIFDGRVRFGPNTLLDFRKYKEHTPLLRDLIASLDEYASPDKIGRLQSASTYVKSIFHLLDYCKRTRVPINFRLSSIDNEFLINYRTHVSVYLSDLKAATRRRIFGNLIRLLKAGQEINLTSSDLVLPSNFPSPGDTDRTEPYTAGEAIDIENACRSDIRELLARLARGQELLAQGEDPRQQIPTSRSNINAPIRYISRPWNVLANLLWFVVNVMDGRYIKRSGLKGPGFSSFNNSTTGAFNGPYRKNDVYSHLYPLAEDLIPFINLLAKSTGRNESSILELSRDCLQEINGRFILWYRKERGGEKLYKKSISSDGEFSPAELIKTLRRITEPLVRLADPEDRNILFLGLTPRSRNENPVKRLDAGYIKYQMNRANGWAEKHDLATEDGEPIRISLRRWRVYYLTLRYKRSGQLGKVSRDAAHTLASTTVDYLDNNFTKHIHEQATEDGIKAALRVARPAVLPSDSVQNAAEQLCTSEQAASSILKGEQDVFFASCNDFYNQPGGRPNTPCDRPWACLECSNAIITRHVLPRALEFKRFMAEQQKSLPLEDWNEKFGKAWQILHESVLPQFSGEALTEAQNQASSMEFYIPLALKAN